jgi:NADH-quinone oxidoreductase subunit N
MTVGAFGILMIVAGQGEDRLQIDDYAGFGWSQPALATLFTIFLLSLAGFPGTGGFMAKIYLLQGAAESRLWVLALILVLGTVVSYYYYLRVAWYMWMRSAPDDEGPRPFWVPLPMRATLVAAAGIILYLGVLPGGILEGALAAAEGMGILAPEGFLGQAPLGLPTAACPKALPRSDPGTLPGSPGSSSIAPIPQPTE